MGATMYKLLIITLLVFQKVVRSQNNELVCDNVKNTLYTEFSQADCIKQGTFYFQKQGNCKPECEIAVTVPIVSCEGVRCPPGYKCVDKRCVLDEDSCFKYITKVSTAFDKDNPYLSATFKPKCTWDGKWEAKQCKGGKTNGRCFCYDEVGNRIFGHEWSHKAEKMTCACSRRRYEMEKSNAKIVGKDFVSLHCDSLGNFQKLQCHLGHCWCVNPQNGDMESSVVTEHLMKHLPCYTKADFSDKYMRQCDSHLYGVETAIKYLNLHGTEFANFAKIMCDADGTYGSVKVAGGLKYCTWKDNKNIGSFMASLGDKDLYMNMNCNCARDSLIFKEAGLDFNMACLQNGNYKPEQTIDEFKYCVDDDGFQIGDINPSKECKDII
ncbi:PREDICTED: uncharacterized protein LOC108563880 [Nicrophorus vespilloides]|uniref:Uncharacterized protein LOC108563880 n=1 Tax=Nicrophorus vespilloides TaxID=110193 RepID=A0ABM1MUC6_NICVS|nr:PREDICTED: uncharacterized protein LOC108563880 [Nicrophorus vespilloides]